MLDNDGSTHRGRGVAQSEGQGELAFDCQRAGIARRLEFLGRVRRNTAAARTAWLLYSMRVPCGIVPVPLSPINGESIRRSSRHGTRCFSGTGLQLGHCDRQVQRAGMGGVVIELYRHRARILAGFLGNDSAAVVVLLPRR